MQCGICNEELGPFPYDCKFCSGNFCISHRLPEKHSCSGLAKWKEENARMEDWVYKATREEQEKAKSERGIIAKIPHKKVVAVLLILMILAGIALFAA